jgi:hypothetical protein
VSEIQVIQAALEQTARRDRWLGAWQGFWRGLLAGSLLFLLIFAGYKVFPLPRWAVIGAAAAGGALTLAGAMVGGWPRRSLLETARWVDDRQQLKERLSTALELAAAPAADEWRSLLVADAARHVTAVDPKRLLPLRLPRISRWALLVLALCAGLGFVPEHRSADYLQRKKDAVNIQNTGKELAGLTRRELLPRPAALPPTVKALEQVAEMGDHLTKASLTRSEALRELANLAQKVGQQTRELAGQPALKPLERAAREREAGSSGQSRESLQQQINALQKSLGNAAGHSDKLDALKQQLEKAQQALAGLADKNSANGQPTPGELAQALANAAREMRDLGQSLAGLEEAIKALENGKPGLALENLRAALTDLDKLRGLAKSLQQLQQQAANLGKDLAEQLEKGQAEAAQGTLQKMIAQLKTPGLSPDQMQKLMDEVRQAIKPGSEYGQVGEHLKNAAEQMNQGQNAGAAQSLAEAAKELEKLMQQMQDAQAMMAALDALERAQAAISSGKPWSECKKRGSCPACGGWGCSLCKGRGWSHGGKPGAGVGTWADEQEGWMHWEESGPVDNSGIERPDMDPRGLTDRPTDLSPTLKPDKVRGQFSPGGQMPSITLKGVSTRGQSTVEYEAAAAAAQEEAQNALNQDKVPRAYQNAVRDYFDDLKK